MPGESQIAKTETVAYLINLFSRLGNRKHSHRAETVKITSTQLEFLEISTEKISKCHR